MNLYKLAKVVLAIDRDGLSKVRFAKTLYFVHKELIRREVMNSEDIAYIRMPLGPVPKGFMELKDNHKDIIVTTEPMGLSYNASMYKLSRRPLAFKKKDDGYRVIEDILKTLREFSTSKLVEVSHEEPSWKKFQNGKEFYISAKDMEKTLPKKSRVNALRNEGREDESLQASLISGMLKDIVDESTDLEHPDNGR